MAQPLVFSGEVLVSRLVTREQYVPKWFSRMEMAIQNSKCQCLCPVQTNVQPIQGLSETWVFIVDSAVKSDPQWIFYACYSAHIIIITRSSQHIIIKGALITFKNMFVHFRKSTRVHNNKSTCRRQRVKYQIQLLHHHRSRSVKNRYLSNAAAAAVWYYYGLLVVLWTGVIC